MGEVNTEGRLSWATNHVRKDLTESDFGIAEEILAEYERWLWASDSVGGKKIVLGSLEEDKGTLWVHQKFTDKFDPRETHLAPVHAVAQTSTRAYLDSNVRSPFLDWLLIDTLIWNEMQRTAETFYGETDTYGVLKNPRYHKDRESAARGGILPEKFSFRTLMLAVIFALSLVFPGFLSPWIPFVLLIVAAGIDVAKLLWSLYLERALRSCSEAYNLLAPSPFPVNPETLLAAVIASRASGGMIDAIAKELLQDVANRGGKIWTLWE